MLETRHIWPAALGQLQLLVNAGNYDTFLRDTRGVGFNGRTFIVSVPNPFIRETLQARFMGLVQKVLADLLGESPEVQFQVTSSAVIDQPVSVLDAPLPMPKAPSSLGSRSTRYTFETFVVGNSNRLAHAASAAVAEQPGQEYNPLFLYGGVGLGKTHLLRAIEHATAERGLSVLYVSSETFTNDLIESIRENRTTEFRQKYRRLQVLLIDDIQFIARAERTQEEFFHTFNDVHAAGGQIVLSSDRQPRAINPLESRLRSRFEWGLIADIQPPDLETRIAILRSKLSGRYDSVPAEVIELLARRAPHNIRELEGAMTRVLAHAQLQGKPLTAELAADAIEHIIPDRQSRPATADIILQAICQHFDVPIEALRGKARDRKTVIPRHYAMYLLRHEARLSLPEIGSLLGGRDHTTVMHGCERIKQDIENLPQVSADLESVRSLFSA